MAYSGRSEMRLAANLNYKGASGTLDSTSVKGPKDMGNNGPRRLVGAMNLTGRNTDGIGKRGLYGATVSDGSPSGLNGPLSGDGFRSGPKWKRAMEPGELKPGTYAQKNNTTRMTPGGNKKPAAMKSTGTTPKALRGGGSGPR